LTRIPSWSVPRECRRSSASDFDYSKVTCRKMRRGSFIQINVEPLADQTHMRDSMRCAFTAICFFVVGIFAVMVVVIRVC
jgi:hypothetical protein